jgi:hypothetical protein
MPGKVVVEVAKHFDLGSSQLTDNGRPSLSDRPLVDDDLAPGLRELLDRLAVAEPADIGEVRGWTAGQAGPVGRGGSLGRSYDLSLARDGAEI